MKSKTFVFSFGESANEEISELINESLSEWLNAEHVTKIYSKTQTQSFDTNRSLTVVTLIVIY